MAIGQLFLDGGIAKVWMHLDKKMALGSQDVLALLEHGQAFVGNLHQHLLGPFDTPQGTLETCGDAVLHCEKEGDLPLLLDVRGIDHRRASCEEPVCSGL